MQKLKKEETFFKKLLTFVSKIIL